MSASSYYVYVLVNEPRYGFQSFSIKDTCIETVRQLYVLSDMHDLPIADQDIVYAEMLWCIDVGISYQVK